VDEVSGTGNGSWSGPWRQVPWPVRHGPQGRGYRGRAQRGPGAESETSGCILHLFGSMRGVLMSSCSDGTGGVW